LQRASPVEHVKQALALQVVAPSESVHSGAVAQVAQSVNPVRSPLQACSVLLPVPAHCVSPAAQVGASQVVFLFLRELSQSPALAHTPSAVACELMRLLGHW
jgi:hypothetical protein